MLSCLKHDLLYNRRMNFRRYYIPGSAVFITQVVQGREPVFRDPENVSLLREILHNVKQLHAFSMLGYVFLPDHFHVVIQPNGESNFSDIMRSLKPNFTKEYKKLIGLLPSQSMKFWQKRFWDHVIRDDRDFENHLHYIHFNPVKHGYVTDPRDWKDSSYIEWEKRGLYPAPFSWEEPNDIAWGE
jgi:putative transposase